MAEQEIFELDGFDELSKMLQSYSNNIDNLKKEQEKVVKAFVADLLKLPAPKSTKSRGTHLVDTFAYKYEKDEFVVGWGKYYGPIVERGHKIANGSDGKKRTYSGFVAAQPHFKKTWEANEKKYYDLLVKNLDL